MTKQAAIRSDIPRPSEKYPLEYKSWSCMRNRCLNKRDAKYRRYGGRGITIASRWRKFDCFLADMGRRPTPKHTLGRIDNDGPYMPANCRWETPTQQQRNRHDTIYVIYKGKRCLLVDLVDEHCSFASAKTVVRHRIFTLNWSVEDALFRPKRPKRPNSTKLSAV